MNREILELKKRTVALYYRILKNHLRRLPSQLRQFGNLYVRHEFDQHRNNQSTLEQYKEFFQAWEDYNTNLQGNRDKGTSLGKSLSEEELSLLSDEQKNSLNQLKDRANDLRK